jgi:Phytoene dehydrogenase and related proteins
MNLITGNGYRFDLGPTIAMMPHVYEDVFVSAGVNPKDYIPMEKIEPMYSLYYDDGDKISVSTDYVEMNRLLEDISYKDAQGFYEYIAEIYKRYLVAKDDFIERSFRGPKDFYNPYTLKQALKLKTFDSAYHTISKYIENDKLRKLLSFQTLYIGVSPYNGPSIYTIIPMIEMVYGVWFIKGGMYTMANSMERLFKEMGGKVQLNTKVDEILFEDKKAIGIRANGEEIFSDYLVCNADFPYAMKSLVKNKEVKGKYTDEKIDSMKYSCSCFLMYLGIDKKNRSNGLP